MSVTIGPVLSESPPDRPIDHVRCQHCSAGLAADQEWCLECGVPRTVIHRAPGWLIPLAIMATVVLLILAAFAIALIGLSNDANRSAAQLTQTVTVSAPAAPALTPAPAAAPAAAAAGTPAPTR
jgi:hypothetical protein